MKKGILVTYVSFVLISYCFGQQQAENPGFEDWEDVGLNVEEPVDWSSIKTSDNSFMNGLAPYVWDKSTDAHTGSYSVKVYNATVLSIVAAGTMTNGRVHADFNPENGYVFTDVSDDRWRTICTDKPDSVVVWVKFIPQGSDVGQVKAVLHSGTAKIPDPSMSNYIAFAEINITSQTTTWTRFSAPFTYFNGNTPEYILFVLNSGGAVAVEGSEAYFDDIELIYVSNLELDLTAFLEGPFNGTDMNTTLNTDGYLPLAQPYNQAPWNYAGTEAVAAIPNANVVDWVLVEIRDATVATQATSQAVVARQAAFILSDGSIVDTDGQSNLIFNNLTIQNSMFVVIWHRNSVGIMSAVPVVETGGIYSYDFTSGAGTVYGGSNAHKEITTGVWGLIGADGNADEQINNGDKIDVWTPQAGSSGYQDGDFNLDGQVNNGDKNDVWVPNTGMGGQVPN
ncbi:MAG: PCMD domain-containing protein [Bacteroidales bacterium]|nr:PCMD domain-containing protein [Bacteroidales bacterium]